LSSCESIIVDRGALLMKRAEFQLKLNDYTASIQTINELFNRGSTENHTAHSLLIIALLQLEDSVCDEALRLKGTQTVSTMICLTEEQKTKLCNYYKDVLQPKHPQSTAMHRIPLSMLNDYNLKQSIDGVCRIQLRKGVPSLCSELRSLLWTESNGRLVRTEDPADIKIHPRYQMYVSLVDDYINSLALYAKFAESDDKEEDSSTVLWTWFLRAGLHEIAGEYDESLILLDKCLEHSPTAVDVYEMKARSLKAIGKVNDAVDCLDKGRELDLQDRYINNQTTRYMLQAGRDDDALKCISLFTRHEGNAEQNLYDMQCSWYELELAACYARKQDWGRSLKKFCT
jgi:N-alpha-acetyltransferase 15/16, NatA auxiliary subunit